MSFTLRSLVGSLLLASLAAAQSPTVRTGYESAGPGSLGAPSLNLTAPCATLAARGWHGQLVPGGGTLSPIAFAWPATIPAGLPFWFQYWIQDPAATKGLSASNGLKGVSG